MEAATPLRKPNVRTIGDQLVVDGLTVTDETAVRVVREREEAGEDAARTVGDAIEIGARVLDREQAAANAEFVKTEFEKVSKEVEAAFGERARVVAEDLGEKVDEVFDPERGTLARALEEHFSDGSSKAVQNRVKEIFTEIAAKSREDLVKAFSAEGGHNPLADFKNSTLSRLDAAEKRQHKVQLATLEKMGELERQLEALRAEREKLEEVEAERERGTAKGRTYEEQVAEALDALAVAQGDCAQAVGDLKGATGRTGDVVVGIGAAEGSERGRLVFEAKDARLSGPKAIAELDAALRERDADYAVLVVPGDDEVPAKMHPLREYNGDKLIVTYDPEAGSRLALEVGYRLARARVLMERSEAGEVDAGAVAESVERAVQALAEERKVKSQLTGAKTSIDNAYELIELMAERVRTHLAQIEALIRTETSDIRHQEQQQLSDV
jgi:hypothetical protein